MWTIENIQSIDLEVTSHCNLACPECARVHDAKDFVDKGHLPLSFIKEHIHKDNLPYLREVVLSGVISDCLMHPEIEQIIEYFLEDVGVQVFVQTNGSLRTPKFFERLATRWPGAEDKLKITFAIDGTDEEANAKYRVNGSYNKAMKNARAFIDAGGFASWQFIVFPWNKHQVEDYRRLAVEYGFETARLVESTRTGVKPDAPDAYEYVDCLYHNDNRIFITYQGSVVPCCHISHLEYVEKERYRDYYDWMDTEGRSLFNSLHHNEFCDIIENYLEPIFNRVGTNPLKVCQYQCKKRGHNRKDDNVIAKG